jgi:hypothetical protein
MKLLFTHHTKRKEPIKFLLLLSVLLGYFGVMSGKYNLASGVLFLH